MTKPFFKHINWDKLRRREVNQEDIPFVPDSQKHFDLLKADLQEVSNLPSNSVNFNVSEGSP